LGTLIQKNKLARLPVGLVGTDYWQPIVQWLRTTVPEKGCVGERDLNQFCMIDDPTEIANWLDSEIDGH
jgi:predicted Rossmann-fold nucleotide-binding protein